jgi:TRAP-type C4-dicarboxylate transport system permease small subunit
MERAPASAWSRAGALLDRIGDLLVVVSAVLLLAMVALMGVEIAARGLLRTSTQVSDEYSGYLFTWITMFCFIYAQRSDRFLRVDSLRSRLAPRSRAAVDAFNGLLAAALVGVLVYATWATFRTSLAFESRSLQPSQTLLWMPQVVMPVGLAVLGLAFLQTAATSLLAALGRLPLPTGAVPAVPLAE